MNKKLLILLAIALVILPVMATACGRTALTGQSLAQPIPHAVDVRFADCLACHVADMAKAKAPFDHVALNYTNKDCSSLPVCHALPTGVATTTPPTTVITTTTNTSTTGTTGTTSTTSTTTTSGGATLTDKAIAITTHNLAAFTAYKGLCQMCHAKGLSNSNPYPPTWDGKASGSTQNTGVYTITPGSPQDHTNYTVDQCTQAGCHAAPTS